MFVSLKESICREYGSRASDARHVCDGLHFHKQMRMRQLVNGDSRPGRARLVEIFAVHFVVAAEVAHIDEERGDFYKIREIRTLAFKYVSHIFDDSARLPTNIE